MAWAEQLAVGRASERKVDLLVWARALTCDETLAVSDDQELMITGVNRQNRLGDRILNAAYDDLGRSRALGQGARQAAIACGRIKASAS
jgi:hypothetical protein